MKRIAFLTLILSGLFFTQCGLDSSTAASIGNDQVTVDELVEQIKKDYRAFKLPQITLEQKYEALEKLVDIRRKAMYAEKLGLTEDPEYAIPREKNDNRLIAFGLYQQAIINTLMPEELIREYYEWERNKIHAIAVVIGYQGAEMYNNDRSLEDANARAAEVIEKLKTAEKPAEVGQAYTDDARNTVELNPYYVGKYTPEVDRAVFSARTGDVIGPIKTKKGLVIIKVTGITEQNIEISFEEAKPRIERAVRRYFTSGEKEMFDELSEKYRQKFNVTVNDDNLPDFFNKVKEWGQQPTTTLETLKESVGDVVLGQDANKPFLGSSFLQIYGEQLKRTQRKFRSWEDIKNIIQSQMTMNAWAAEGRSQGIDDKPDVRREMNSFRLNALGQILIKREVDDKIELNAEKLESHYKENLERYKVPEKMRVYQLSINDKALAQKAARELRRNPDFQKTFNKYKSNYANKSVKYTAGFQTRNSPNKDIVKLAFDAGNDKVLGPVEKDGSFMIIGTSDYQAEVIRTFSEVENTIRSELFNSMREQGIKDLTERLREEFTYDANDDAIRRIGQDS